MNRRDNGAASRPRTCIARADELLDQEIFCAVRETKALIGGWRQHYNTVRPYRAPGYQPSALAAVALPHLALPPRLALEFAGSPN